MARLVPARPLFDTDAEEAAMLALEGELDDSYVVFQKRPADGYLVAHPDKGLCLLVVAAGERTWDPDGETWSGLDIRGLVKSTRAAVRGSRAIPVPVVVWFVDTARPYGMTDPKVIFAGEDAVIASAVAAVFSAAGAEPLGEEGIDRTIQSLSPGAARYARGNVTEAQRSWRASLSDQSAPQPPAAVLTVVPFHQGAREMVVEVAEREPVPPPEAAPFVVVTPQPLAVIVGEQEMEEDDPLLALLKQIVDSLLPQGHKYVAGFNISTDEVVAPNFLLPAVLLTAAEDWAPVVFGSGGKGGFHVRLRTDEEALLGYRVVSVKMSSPFLMFLPVTNKLRETLLTAANQPEAHFNQMVAQFTRFLSKNRINTDAVGEIDVHLAFKEMDG